MPHLHKRSIKSDQESRAPPQYAASLRRLQMLLTVCAGAGTSTCSNSACTRGAQQQNKMVLNAQG